MYVSIIKGNYNMSVEQVFQKHKYTSWDDGGK